MQVTSTQPPKNDNTVKISAGVGAAVGAVSYPTILYTGEKKEQFFLDALSYLKIGESVEKQAKIDKWLLQFEKFLTEIKEKKIRVLTFSIFEGALTLAAIGAGVGFAIKGVKKLFSSKDNSLPKKEDSKASNNPIKQPEANLQKVNIPTGTSFDPFAKFRNRSNI